MNTHWPEGYFGRHHHLVMEVWKVGMSHPGFASPSNPPPHGVVVVHSLEVAQLLTAIIPSVGEDPLDWEDFLENHRCDYMDSAIEVDRAVVSRTINAFRDVQERFAAMYAGRPWLEERVLSNTGALFADCAWARAVHGRGCEFWEQVFVCLQSGVVPINWRGRWNEGDLVVYVPPAERSKS